jgi:hypothetical protein
VEEITVKHVAPFLTDRGRIELDFAIQSFNVARLSAEVERLTTELENQADDDGWE